MLPKYYTIQNGMLTVRDNKQLAESIYALDKKASLVEVLPDRVLLYNRAYTTGFITCDDKLSAFYIASQLSESNKTIKA